MNQIATIVLVACVSGMLGGCELSGDKHEIVRAGNQTFILNKATGEAQLIDGTSLVSIKAPDKELGDDQAIQAKSWPSQEIPQLGNIKLTVRTKYRDGNMLYYVSVGPFSGRLEKEFSPTLGGSDYLRQPTLYLDFYDGDGFPSGESVELKIRGATRVVNEKGEAYALTWTGTQAMSIKTYKSTTTQNVRWAGFS